MGLTTIRAVNYCPCTVYVALMDTATVKNILKVTITHHSLSLKVSLCLIFW